jgi:hypothetical protein
MSAAQLFPDTSSSNYVLVDNTGDEHYNMGPTNATLLVTDLKGLTATCSTTVTVVVRLDQPGSRESHAGWFPIRELTHRSIRASRVGRSSTHEMPQLFMVSFFFF